MLLTRIVVFGGGSLLLGASWFFQSYVLRRFGSKGLFLGLGGQLVVSAVILGLVLLSSRVPDENLAGAEVFYQVIVIAILGGLLSVNVVTGLFVWLVSIFKGKS